MCVCVCTCVHSCVFVHVRVLAYALGCWLFELLFLLIIEMHEASRKRLRVLSDNTPMIMSDLQPSAILVMTLHDFIPLPPLQPPFSVLPHPTLLYI